MLSIAVLYMVIKHTVSSHQSHAHNGPNEEIFYYDNCSSSAGWIKTYMSEPQLSDLAMSDINLEKVSLSNSECVSGWCFQIEAGNAITSLSISVTNHTDIQLQYSIKPFLLQPNDVCQAYYTQNNNNWTLLTQYGALKNNEWTNTIQPLLLFNHSESIKIRFYLTENSINKTDSRCFIDEIYLFGTHVNDTDVDDLEAHSGIMLLVIIFSSICFLVIICIFKVLSEQVETCMFCNRVLPISVDHASAGDSRLEEEKREEEEDADRLRGYDYAAAEAFPGTSVSLSMSGDEELYYKGKKISDLDLEDLSPTVEVSLGGNVFAVQRPSTISDVLQINIGKQ